VTELKNLERELARFRARLIAAAAFVLLGFGLLAARLVHLQVHKHADLATQAEANRIAVLPIVPNRGLIVDRNGVVVATNYSAYTLELAPARVRDLEGTIDELARLAQQVNERAQNIGARRLHTILERLLDDVSLDVQWPLPPAPTAGPVAAPPTPPLGGGDPQAKPNG